MNQQVAHLSPLKLASQELILFLHFMHVNPQEKETTDFHESEQNTQLTFQRAFEQVRRNLREKEKRRNAIYSKKVHAPTYKGGQKVWFYHPAIAVGTTSNFASLWKGPYIKEERSNDVTFRIKEEKTSKQQFVYYDRLKPFFEPPPTHNLRTGNRPRNSQSPQFIVDTHKHKDLTLNHGDCLTFLPAPCSVSTPRSTGGQ